LETACEQVGEAAKQGLSSAGEGVSQALSEAADSFRESVKTLPSGDAKNALSSVCDSLKSRRSERRLGLRHPACLARPRWR
jgi:hypothetical protein